MDTIFERYALATVGHSRSSISKRLRKKYFSARLQEFVILINIHQYIDFSDQATGPDVPGQVNRHNQQVMTFVSL